LYVVAATRTTTVLRALRAAEGAATSARRMNFYVAVSGPSHHVALLIDMVTTSV